MRPNRSPEPSLKAGFEGAIGHRLWSVRMEKLTSVQIKNLLELKTRGGVVMTSRWVVGSGSYTSRKAVPPFSKRLEKSLAYLYPQHFTPEVLEVFKKHPRCKAVVAITDKAAADKAINQYLENQE